MEIDPKKVREILDSLNIGDATISPEGFVHVHGSVDLCGRWLSELPVMFQRIDGDADFDKNHLRTLGPLEYVGEKLSVSGLYDDRDGVLESLGELEEVGGTLRASHQPRLTSLRKLRRVGGNLSLAYSSVRSLGDLTSVGRVIDLEGVPLVDIPNRHLVARSVDLSDLSALMSVWGLISEMEDLYRLLRQRPEDAPLILATARYEWQRAVAKEFLELH